jgi:hypothetical protein
MVEPIVCIFPHSDDEFATADELRSFLGDWLSTEESKGRYRLGRLGWKDKDFKAKVISCSLVLFRKGKDVVGHAVVHEPIRELDPPEHGKTEHDVPKDYYHDIIFDPQSVRVYDLSVESLEKWVGCPIKPRFYTILSSRRDYERAFGTK